MITIDSDVKQAYISHTVHRKVMVKVYEEGTLLSTIERGGDITNLSDEYLVTTISDNHIVSESMEIERSIIDGDELRFGGCYASQFKIQAFDISGELVKKDIKVYLYLTIANVLYPADDLFPRDDLFPYSGTDEYRHCIFTGTIDSAKRQKNRTIKEIVAFDTLYGNSQRFREAMAGIAAQAGNRSLKVVREYLENSPAFDGSAWIDESVMFNDQTAMSMTVRNVRDALDERTEKIDILRAYCELNAAFGYCDNEGRLKYKQLLSPAVEHIPAYSELDWEEYVTAPINLIQFYYGGSDPKPFKYGHAQERPSEYVSDNLITKCCTDIGDFVRNFNDNNGHNYIFGNLYQYRPFRAVLFDYWWLEPGDKVIIDTGTIVEGDQESVESYVLSMTITGIQHLKTTIEAKGQQYLRKEEEDVI